MGFSLRSVLLVEGFYGVTAAIDPLAVTVKAPPSWSELHGGCEP
jgi:hypothetical protein